MLSYGKPGFRRRDSDPENSESDLTDSDEDDSEAGEKCIILLSSLLNSGPDFCGGDKARLFNGDARHLYGDENKSQHCVLTTGSILAATATAVAGGAETSQAESFLETSDTIALLNINSATEPSTKFETAGKTDSGGEYYRSDQLASSHASSEMRGNLQDEQGGGAAVEFRSTTITEHYQKSSARLMSTAAAAAAAASPMSPATTAAASQEVGGVKVRPRPQIPPKPQIDAIRYSMANVQESCDRELDTLLEELSALESQLNSSAGDQLLLGLPTLPISDSKSSNMNSGLRGDLNASISSHSVSYESTKRAVSSTLSDDFMRPVASSSICPSPDHDSAFGDSSSTESRNRCRNSAISSSDSCRGSLNTPSPTQQVSPNQSTSSTSLDGVQQPKTANEIKAAKIREALEKMREADIKKLYVKFFLDDGTSTLSMLIDERWTVAEVIRMIAEKQRVQVTQNHTIVEEYPDLYIRRIYEDHEYLVENIMMWTQNSKNKLYFTRRPDKFAFIDRPEEFLVTERNIDLLTAGQTPTPETRKLLVKEFFETDNVQPPEVEGWLLLKADGKKSWRKHFFVLRSSGLYYCPKGKSRNSKDLQCLMNMQTNQVYTCTDWRKKYKAPTNFGFAIKHPKIQVKASKYIKYVCAEDAVSYHKWMAALRIAKNGRKLYDNYEEIQRRLQSTSAHPVKVDIPQIAADCHPVPTVEMRKSSRQDAVPLLNISRDTKSPALSRMSSSLTSSERSYANHNSIVFDQCDDAMTGTIKKAPCEIMSQSRRQSSQVDTHSSVGTSSPSMRSTADLGADSDSDEEQFPPPPPTVTVTATVHHENHPSSHRSSFTPAVNDCNVQLRNQQNERPHGSPAYSSGILSPAKHANKVNGSSNHMSPASEVSSPQRSGILKKVPPPPPPKRSETTRIHSTAAEALHNELEIAMARRLKQIEQH